MRTPTPHARSHARRARDQVRFDYAADEQIEHMWASFYPASAARAPAFREAMRAALDGRTVTTADLQHFFVMQMRSSAEPRRRRLRRRRRSPTR